MIVVPKQNGLVARVPGLLRKIIERIGFKDDEIAEMIRLAAERCAGKGFAEAAVARVAFERDV